jgi:hypothetical protein
MNRSATLLSRALLPAVVVGALAIGAPALADHSRKAERERHVEPACILAGTLIVDGRCYEIFDRGDIERQIVRALECAGYDAWCHAGSIRVRKECGGPDICWRAGEYELLIRRIGHTYSLRLVRCEPVEDRCDDDIRLRYPRIQGPRFGISIRIGGRCDN